MYATVRGIALRGLEGFAVGVEADLQTGLPAFDIVGLPTSSVREAKERVRSAIVNSGFKWPRSRVIISLTPADWRKDGTGLDLPIALAVLAASEQIPLIAQSVVMLGELALDGGLRGFRGLWTAARAALDTGARRVIAPAGDDVNDPPEDDRVYPVATLLEALAALSGLHSPSKRVKPLVKPLVNPSSIVPIFRGDLPDFTDIVGHQTAKRALEVAAAGEHHLLLVGPPGAGKSLLAQSLGSILPELDPAHWTEVRQLYSVAGLRPPSGQARPFRNPHHSVTPQGLFGGGARPHPGEVSLAHRGILFLDEFPEFSRAALEGLRQPLETGLITLSRAAYACTFPSAFQLIAAMNPCPCGYWGTSLRACTCDSRALDRYRAKLSGPLLDRMDMTLWIDPIPPAELLRASPGPEVNSADVRERVNRARLFRARRASESTMPNGKSSEQNGSSPRAWAKSYRMGSEAYGLLFASAEKMRLSPRSLHRIIRVSRSIADLDAESDIHSNHVAEALQYRFYS